MANITDNTKLDGHVDLAADGKQNWISQINAGGTVYDIATHHGITFREGNGGATTTWNGLTDLEVIIPSIADIVQTPIEFAGTVGADGQITWVNGQTKAEAGSLVFITENCTFDGKPCEKGDMAIYDGTTWYTVSGEHQIDIVGTADNTNKVTVAVGSAKNVLTVEGKTLALVLDYAELDTHVVATGGGKVDVVFGGADAQAPAVKSEYIKLAYTAASDREIATQVSFENATALANGKVTFTNDTFVTGVSFGDFNAGSFPVYNTNGQTDFAVSGGSLSGVTTGEDFVTRVSLPAISVVQGDAGKDNTITAITEISAAAGTQSFLTDIHLTDAEKNEIANLTIGGYLAPNAGKDAAFVTGLADKTTTVITGITAGNFKLVDGGKDIVTGLEGDATEVVTGVTVEAPANQDVLSSATVENNVLVLGTAKAVSSVNVTPTTAGFKKVDVSYTPTTFTSTSLITDGFTMTSDVKYTFGSAKETVYDYDTYTWAVVTPELTVEKGKYTIADGGKVTISANTFLTGVKTEGKLPSLTNTSFSTGKVEGSVATALTTETKNINALAEGVTSIATPGTYSLTTVSAAESGAVAVGKAGLLDNMTATVDLTKYLTDVTIVTDASAPKAE